MILKTDETDTHKSLDTGFSTTLNETELIIILKVEFAYQRCFGTVDLLPHQDTKVCPWQEAAKYIANFIM